MLPPLTAIADGKLTSPSVVKASSLPPGSVGVASSAPVTAKETVRQGVRAAVAGAAVTGAPEVDRHGLLVLVLVDTKYT